MIFFKKTAVCILFILFFCFDMSTHVVTLCNASYDSPNSGNDLKEFLMASTYGVMAGTLVGASALAFTKQPGENLNIVARGASLGLYAGMILGLYVVYLVPNLPPPGGGRDRDSKRNDIKSHIKEPKQLWSLQPFLDEKQQQGLQIVLYYSLN